MRREIEAILSYAHFINWLIKPKFKFKPFKLAAKVLV